MKRNFSLILALSAIVLTAGCKKSAAPSSIDLARNAKAGFVTNADWQQPGITGRVVRFDVDDGNGSDCLLAYDVGTNEVSLTQVNGTNSTTLFTSAGFWCDNHVMINVNLYLGDVTDNYNEVGGFHVIPFDADGTGHEDHVLIYAPGRGVAYLLSYDGGGYWHECWSSTSGIGGYDLHGPTDKIIAYDYGSGYKNALICYRPGYQFFWVLQDGISPGSPAQTVPNFTAAVKSNGGVGGFDLKGSQDQIVAIPTTNSPGNMQIVCYRPGPTLGFVWWETHSAYSTGWSPVEESRSGLNGNSFQALGDRMIAVNLSTSGATGYNWDTYMFGYRPGYGLGYSFNYQWVPSLGFVETWNLFGGLNYPMNHLPYSPNTYEGDHVVAFSPQGKGNTSLLFYGNGTSTQSQIYEWNSGYTQVY
jgi:hypothetical protein